MITAATAVEQPGSLETEYDIAEEIGYRHSSLCIALFNANMTNHQVTSRGYIPFTKNLGAAPINTGGQTSRGIQSEFGARAAGHEREPDRSGRPGLPDRRRFRRARVGRNRFLRDHMIDRGKHSRPYAPLSPRTSLPGRATIRAKISGARVSLAIEHARNARATQRTGLRMHILIRPDAASVSRAIEGPLCAALPASALQTHPRRISCHDPPSPLAPVPHGRALFRARLRHMVERAAHYLRAGRIPSRQFRCLPRPDGVLSVLRDLRDSGLGHRRAHRPQTRPCAGARNHGGRGPPLPAS